MLASSAQFTSERSLSYMLSNTGSFRHECQQKRIWNSECCRNKGLSDQRIEEYTMEFSDRNVRMPTNGDREFNCINGIF